MVRLRNNRLGWVNIHLVHEIWCAKNGHCSCKANAQVHAAINPSGDQVFRVVPRKDPDVLTIMPGQSVDVPDCVRELPDFKMQAAHLDVLVVPAVVEAPAEKPASVEKEVA